MHVLVYSAAVTQRAQIRANKRDAVRQLEREVGLPVIRPRAVYNQIVIVVLVVVLVKQLLSKAIKYRLLRPSLLTGSWTREI